MMIRRLLIASCLILLPAAINSNNLPTDKNTNFDSYGSFPDQRFDDQNQIAFDKSYVSNAPPPLMYDDNLSNSYVSPSPTRSYGNIPAVPQNYEKTNQMNTGYKANNQQKNVANLNGGNVQSNNDNYGVSGGYSAQPSGGYSGQPSGGYSGQPSGGYSGQPSGGYSGQQSGGYSGQPSGGYSGQPSGGYSGKPSGGYSGQPSGSYSGQPAGLGLGRNKLFSSLGGLNKDKNGINGHRYGGSGPSLINEVASRLGSRFAEMGGLIGRFGTANKNKGSLFSNVNGNYGGGPNPSSNDYNDYDYNPGYNMNTNGYGNQNNPSNGYDKNNNNPNNGYSKNNNQNNGYSNNNLNNGYNNNNNYPNNGYSNNNNTPNNGYNNNNINNPNIAYVNNNPNNENNDLYNDYGDNFDSNRDTRTAQIALPSSSYTDGQSPMSGSSYSDTNTAGNGYKSNSDTKINFPGNGLRPKNNYGKSTSISGNYK